MCIRDSHYTKLYAYDLSYKGNKMEDFKVEEIFDQSKFCLLPKYSKQLILPRRVKAWDSRLYHKKFNNIYGYAAKTLPFDGMAIQGSTKNCCAFKNIGNKTDRQLLKKESSSSSRQTQKVRTRPSSGKSINKQRSFVAVQSEKMLGKVDSTRKVKCYLC
eukprot:TRINITY_DN8384_c0_g1_i25.p1 TRINITY_DN8384_c0_g1~~TRINITY_DN8384_c0_g1_i25.p1  ORF type:complete len:159 (-),score=4.64 TRINITY_DN8384_c0_g1_i25:243-719(-)